MSISIVIPALNESACIGQTVAHLLQYGGGHVQEVLVVDGGSTDDTVGQAEAAGAMVLPAPEKGRALQMNFGAAHSQGDIVYFVHADTLPPACYAGDILQAVQNGYQMGNFEYRFDRAGWLLQCNAWFTKLPFLFCQGGDKTFFIRKQDFQALGGYDAKHIVMEEYDFVRRARKAGYKLAILPAKCTVSARKYERNSWMRVQAANLLVYNLWSWGLAKPDKLKDIYRKILR